MGSSANGQATTVIAGHRPSAWARLAFIVLVLAPAAQLTIPDNAAAEQALVNGVTSIDVTAHGAVPDYSTDSTAAIQATIDAAQATVHSRRRVVFPAGGTNCYKLTQPLRVRDSNLVLEGETTGLATQSPCIKSDGFIGPLLHLSATHIAPSYTASLIAGRGAALALSESTFDDDTWIDLKDAGPAAQLNGRSLLTVELFFRMTSPPAAGSFRRVLLASSGNLSSGSNSANTAFSIEVGEDLSLHGTMALDGMPVSLDSSRGFLSVATVYHVALSYDGRTLRLYCGTPGNTSTAGRLETSHRVGDTTALGTHLDRWHPQQMAGRRTQQSLDNRGT